MGDLEFLRVLSADSIDELRIAVGSGRGVAIWGSSLEQLVKEMGLVLVDTTYEFNSAIELRCSDGASLSRELDAANARRMLQALPTLTLADGIDERIWVTLALGHYREYMLDRWPRARAAIDRHIQNHVFAATGRTRERDHAIARLWWTGKYVERFAPSELVPVLQGLFSNSDIPGQIHAGRPNIAAMPQVAKACLSLVREHFVDRELPFDRTAFRRFMEDVDFLAGRRALGMMDESRVRELVRGAFSERFPDS